MTEPDLDALALAFAKLGLEPDEMRTVAAVLMCLSFANETSPTGKPGRPKKQRAIYCAKLALGAIEEMTGCRFDLPRSNNNTRPHRVETVLREIFAQLGIAANPKSAINAAALSLRVTAPVELNAFRDAGADRRYHPALTTESQRKN